MDIISSKLSVIDLGGRSCQYTMSVMTEVEDITIDEYNACVAPCGCVEDPISTDTVSDDVAKKQAVKSVAKTEAKKVVAKNVAKKIPAKATTVPRVVIGPNETPAIEVVNEVVNDLGVKGLFDEVPTLKPAGGIFPDREIAGLK